MTSVHSEWESFAKAILPDDASPIQRQEMRRAFFAGCWAMLMACGSLGESSVSEDEGVAQLERWTLEIERFNDLVKTGRA